MAKNSRRTLCKTQILILWPLPLLISLLLGCAVPDVQQELSFPETGYLFYSGTEDEAGHLYTHIIELEQASTGQVVVLLPMIHYADPSFCRAVQEEIDRADVVLMEGVGGTTSLLPSQFILYYLFANQLRETAYLGLTSQHEGIVLQSNWRNADLSRSEFQMQMPWWTSIIHLIAIPLSVVVGEPYNLGKWLKKLPYQMVGQSDEYEARRRHDRAYQFRNLEATQEVMDLMDRFYMPGIITERNEYLLKEFDQVSAEPGIQRIAIPWGAAHMPGVEEALKEKGFEAARDRWIRAIAVRRYTEEPRDEENDPWNFMIPYVIHWRSHESAWFVSTLASSIQFGERAYGYSVDVLWSLLFSMNKNEREEGFQILPALFGRPLLFDWTRRGDHSRYRFLLFFEIGSL